MGTFMVVDSKNFRVLGQVVDGIPIIGEERLRWGCIVWVLELKLQFFFNDVLNLFH